MYDITANKLKDMEETRIRFCPSKKTSLYFRQRSMLHNTENKLSTVDNIRSRIARQAAFKNGPERSSEFWLLNASKRPKVTGIDIS